MERSTWAIESRALSAVRRGTEVAAGIALFAMGVFFSLVWCVGLVTLVNDPSQFESPPLGTVAGILIFGAISAWCVLTGWRLMTGRERRGGGLLSPLALIVIGAACAAGAIAEVVFLQSRGLNLFALLGIALLCFRMAHVRLRPGGADRGAA